MGVEIIFVTKGVSYILWIVDLDLLLSILD